MENEIWKSVVGFEGICEISNKRNLRRIIYKGKSVKFPIKLKYHPKGYLICGLRSDQPRKFVLIHRLVAIAFIPNPENKCDVNHIDGNKANNKVENLEWATRSENVQHSWDNGLSKINSGCYKIGNYPARWLNK